MVQVEQGLKVNQVRRATLACKAQPDPLGHKVTRGRRVHGESRGRPELKARKANVVQVEQGLKVNQVRRATLACKAQPDPLGHKVTRGRRVHGESRDRPELKGRRVSRAKSMRIVL